MKMIGYFLILIVSQQALAQRYDSSPLINEMMYRYEINRMLKGHGKKSKSEDEIKKDCLKILDQSRSTWLKHLRKNGEALQKQGFIDKKFSVEEIELMPHRHPHLRSNIRGHNQLINAASFGHAPIFPHARPECENYFHEKVEVVKIQNRSCRQIKLTFIDNDQLAYYQSYCADDSTIFINYAPDNKTTIDPNQIDSLDCFNCP